MKVRFKTAKHAREETIGRAVTMAQVAVREHRAFNAREQRQVESLLLTAETLELEKSIPRDAAELIAFGNRRLNVGLTRAIIKTLVTEKGIRP